MKKNLQISKLSLIFLFLALLTSVEIYYASPARAASSQANQQYIQFTDYLPLIKGNKWVMHSDDFNVDLTYEVTQSSEGTHLLKLHNPWITWEAYLFPLNDKIYLSRMKIDNNDFSIGGYSLYYDFSSPEGSSKPVTMGNLVVAETNKSVTIGDKTYTNCIKLELTSADDFKQVWTFAPSVGFIEFEFVGGIFKLNESASIVNTLPVNDVINWSQPLTKGDRFFSVDVNAAEDGNYMDAFAKAKQLGTQVTGFHLDWNVIETAPEQYQSAIFNNISWLAKQQNIGINLVIAPIHSVVNNMPWDISNLPFDNPIVINRFKKLLDHIHSKLPNVNVQTLVIGSEIDAYLKSDVQKWLEYQAFYANVSTYARALFQGTQISTEFTFMQGYLGDAKPFIQQINLYSDVIGISYYPRDIEGFVLDPKVVHQHFKTMAEAFPNKPIYFFQFGYPSSTAIGSSEDIQTSFIENTFMAWDTHKDHIKLVNFTFLHDLEYQEILDSMDQFQQSDINFIEFLGSLGLREAFNNGIDKLSFTALEEETNLRGWH